MSGNIEVGESGIAYISFTERGKALAEALSAEFGGDAYCTRGNSQFTLKSWTEEHFYMNSALVYIGAVGIAVRAIAPHLKSKASDPAVVAVDELGHFAVPLSSGHLGGANDIARRIAAFIGGIPVITTPTDLNGVFAIDEWTKRHNCRILNIHAIKNVSAKLLHGGTVRIYSAFPFTEDQTPSGIELTRVQEKCDVLIDIHTDGYAPEAICELTEPLFAVPQILTLGIGCKRGTAREVIERRFHAFCANNGIHEAAFESVATVDLKADERGLLEFCTARNYKLHTFTAEELRRVKGDFTASQFVESKIGIDNVCERAAVLQSDGELIVRKYAGEGVTFAAAQPELIFDWTWTE